MVCQKVITSLKCNPSRRRHNTSWNLPTKNNLADEGCLGVFALDFLDFFWIFWIYFGFFDFFLDFSKKCTRFFRVIYPSRIPTYIGEDQDRAIGKHVIGILSEVYDIHTDFSDFFDFFSIFWIFFGFFWFFSIFLIFFRFFKTKVVPSWIGFLKLKSIDFGFFFGFFWIF